MSGRVNGNKKLCIRVGSHVIFTPSAPMDKIRYFIIYTAMAWLWLMPTSTFGQTSRQPGADATPSPTEGVVTGDFVGEKAMMDDLLQMLTRFGQYMMADFQPCEEPNSIGEECGCFRGESTMASNEAGVRTNADLSMLCAFLVRYAQPAGLTLPRGITWEEISDIAMKSLIFAYSTHKANKLKKCSGGDWWGSTSKKDRVWESSLWAMSVAYSAFFQWNLLSEKQKEYIHALLKAECNYELERDIPTGYKGDTKAEENGWEVDVLAAALGLFPDDPLAPQWYERLRLFAINCHSHPADSTNHAVVDKGREGTVANLYRGQNLYEDYTLQNHDYFHTSYQNVVIQELGEAFLTLQLFQTELKGEQRWATNALTHNCQEVTDHVLNWLALTDGELAMPNGNDWSMFLYDQITAYSFMATQMRDANALMLENLAYKYIKARQATTKDGSWLLRPDVQARRMGVQGHRVMMTYLMHQAWSTEQMTPTKWEDFRNAHSEARLLTCQNIIRAFTPHRFTTFSWSEGLKSYTGYITANSVDKNKIIVPYRAYNTGNFIGWYDIKDKAQDAQPIVSGRYDMKGDAYTMYGELLTNGGTLDHRFAIFSTPGNAVGYLDHVSTLADVTINKEQGGLMAISVDELTRTKRTLYHQRGKETTDGANIFTADTEWMNIDNEVGFVSIGTRGMAFGNRANNNSIMTAKMYPAYSTTPRTLTKGTLADRRNVVYYCQVDATTTRSMARQTERLAPQLPDGWNGIIASDPDRTRYLMLAHFEGEDTDVTITARGDTLGAPVFENETAIRQTTGTATFLMAKGSALMQTICCFVKGDGVIAQQVPGDSKAMWLKGARKTSANVSIISGGNTYRADVKVGPSHLTKVFLDKGRVKTTKAKIKTKK